MELDDLKTAWRELDRRLDSNHALNLRVLKEMKLDRMHSTLRRLAGLLVYELISGVVATLLVGSFLARHFREMKFAFPGVVLDAVALFTIVASIRQLAALGCIDYSAPVLALQHKLAGLRASRVRMTCWLLLLSPLLWTPLAIVVAQGLFGFDIYRGIGSAWIALNLALGLAVIPLAIWIARRHAEQVSGSPLLNHVSDAIAGRSLAAARAHLEEIRRFQDELG